MKLKITSFPDAGNLAKERLVIQVFADLDIGDYLVMRSRVSERSPTPGKKATFWFPDKDIKSGDRVVLYSKAGAASEKALKSGGRAHFFYWDLDEAVWGESKHGAVLVHAAEWEFEIPETKEVHSP